MRRRYDVLTRVMAIAVGLVAVAAASAAGGSQLRVVQVWVPGSFYYEGSYSYFRVEQLDGTKILQRRLPLTARPSLTVPLPTGRYRLRSWQRPCDGNCGYLDPPTDRCARTFRVRHGQRLNATIRLRPGAGCTISFRA